MNHLSVFDFKKYGEKFSKENQKKKGKPPHSKAALVDEILLVVGKSTSYNYPYWLKQLKNFETKGGQPGTVLAWLKEIAQYPSDFNKGGALTNKLKNYGTKQHKDSGDQEQSGSIPK